MRRFTKVLAATVAIAGLTLTATDASAAQPNTIRTVKHIPHRPVYRNAPRGTWNAYPSWWNTYRVGPTYYNHPVYRHPIRRHR